MEININDSNGITITDKRTITILKNERSKKKTKNENEGEIKQEYYSYQLQIPKGFIQLIQKDQKPAYIYKITDTGYLIANENNKYSNTPLAQMPFYAYTNKTNTLPLTLPKKQIEYLKAYDKLINTINMINQDLTEDKQFKRPPLTAIIRLNQYNKEVTPIYHIHISLNANLDTETRLIKYIQEDNKECGGLPGWFELLLNRGLKLNTQELNSLKK